MNWPDHLDVLGEHKKQIYKGGGGNPESFLNN